MRIDDINLAAAILTSTGHQPEVSNYPEGQLQTFTFPDIPEVIDVITRFTTGELSLPAKRLLSCRSALYKRLRTGGHSPSVPQLRGTFDRETMNTVVALVGEVG